MVLFVFFCKQKTAYERRISDWSSDVCSSDLAERGAEATDVGLPLAADIEQAGVEGDGHGEAGEHEVCGVVEGVADGEVIAKGAVEDDQLGRAPCRGRVCQYV